MARLIFATNNKNKVEEIKNITGGSFDIVSLEEAGIHIEIPEPHATLEENAREKSKTIFELTGENCFSEDTGLETDALNGEPGVKSARYAGEARDAADNWKKLLDKLKDTENRKARFRTVISVIFEKEKHLFEGICEGSITRGPKGNKGFGYDPVFVPAGATLTFAEMGMAEKNLYSHRKKAMDQLLAFLSRKGKNLYH